MQCRGSPGAQGTLDGREASARSGRAQLVVGSARWAEASSYDPLTREHLKQKGPVSPIPAQLFLSPVPRAVHVRDQVFISGVWTACSLGPLLYIVLNALFLYILIVAVSSSLKHIILRSCVCFIFGFYEACLVL